MAAGDLLAAQAGPRGRLSRPLPTPLRPGGPPPHRTTSLNDCCLSTSTRIRIFGASTPSYDELAAESWELALRKRFPEDTLRDRVEYAVRACRLSSAAQWQQLGELHFAGYYRRFILTRLAPSLAVILLALYLWETAHTAGPQAWVLVELLAVSLASASLWAVLHWPQPRRDLAFAAQYRAARLERERQLLSPQGWNGWRAEVRSDGSYVMVPVEPTPSPVRDLPA